MALYLSVGDRLMSPDELYERAVMGTLETIAKTSVSLLGLPDGKRTSFEPVGPGKPLAIEIRKIFTGHFPEQRFYDLGETNTRDMFVTTAHKPITQTSRASRAINLLKPEVGRKHTIDAMAATDVGTPIVYYSPAMLDAAVSVTVEFGFEEFSKKLLRTISAAFQTAASIPVFATQSNLQKVS